MFYNLLLKHPCEFTVWGYFFFLSKGVKLMCLDRSTCPQAISELLDRLSPDSVCQGQTQPLFYAQ